MTNLFNEAFPEVGADHALETTSAEIAGNWPVVPGEFHILGDGPGFSVAISTLASPDLADELAAAAPHGLAIVGKTETENLGVEKVVLNTITNPWIDTLVLAGKDPKGHHSGKTLLAVGEHGVDSDMRVIDSPGRHPVLKNLVAEEVEAFREQVRIVDMMGLTDTKAIIAELEGLNVSVSQPALSGDTAHDRHARRVPAVKVSSVPIIRAGEAKEPKLDKEGYFVIIPRTDKNDIVVEHYSNDNRLLRMIEGDDPRDIYLTIINNGWLSRLDHSAYLGKELEKAGLSLKLGFKYIQDGA